MTAWRALLRMDGGAAEAAEWAALLPPGKRRPMTDEEKALKQACIDEYALAANGGAESNGAGTAQYAQCEHGFVLISGTEDTTLQPRCR